MMTLTICSKERVLIRPQKWLLVVMALSGAFFSSLDAAEESAPPQYPLPTAIPKFPANSGLIDVTRAPYRADNTGRRDATDAIRAAINDSIAFRKWYGGALDKREEIVPRDGQLAALDLSRVPRNFIIYLPEGIYRVSDSLSLGGDINLARNIHFVGDGPDKTILRLDPEARGFDNPSAPKTVLSFLDSRWSNIAMPTSIRDLAIEIGSGNPGAIALNYHNNDVSFVRRFRLVAAADSGRIGLQLGQNLAGIGTLSQIEVKGFDIGISNVNNQHVTYVLEHSKISGQKQAGIRSHTKGMVIRKLESHNSVPVVYQDRAGGQVVIIESTLMGGASDADAIVSQGGHLLVRDVTVEGYANSVNDQGNLLTGRQVTEYVSEGAVAADPDTQPTTMRLPIYETPNLPWPPASEWAIVKGAGSGDQTAAIQAAIDSGAEVVFFPTGSYLISDTIVLRGGNQRLYGNWSHFLLDERFKRSGKPVFQIEGGDRQDVVMIECFDTNWVFNGNYYWIQHDSPKTLVLKDLFFGYGHTGYRASEEGAGDVFIDDICFGGHMKHMQSRPSFIFNNQRVWARHFNTEGYYPHVVNNGGTLWILGAKMGEWHGPYLKTINAGRTEALGIIFNALQRGGISPNTPLMINDNSQTVVVGLEQTGVDRHKHGHTIIAQEILGEVQHDILKEDFPRRQVSALSSIAIPLYRGGLNIDPSDIQNVEVEARSDTADSSGKLVEMIFRRTGDFEVTLEIPFILKSEDNYHLNGVEGSIVFQENISQTVFRIPFPTDMGISKPQTVKMQFKEGLRYELGHSLDDLHFYLKP